MKTTLDLSDAVLERAKAHARREGLTLRAVVEDALRRHLDNLECGAASRKEFCVEPWGEGGFLPEYRGKSWNEILDEVNAGPEPDDRR
jgi:hypothetical protein